MGKPIGICGHFGFGKHFCDGQTVKTKTLQNEFVIQLGTGNVVSIDTYNWKRKPISLLLQCFKILKTADNIFVLPAHKGAKVLLPLFSFLNTLFRKRLHYAVIGGWLPELLKKNKWLIKRLLHFDSILVETKFMKERLEEIGLANVDILPNFKRVSILKLDELESRFSQPYPLCTFSRVMFEKGIEDAINTVTKINKEVGSILFTLDIYGQIDIKYQERFSKIMGEAPEYIQYKGVVPFSDSVQILKKYFLLLFPTKFFTEGIPGTIIDAYAAGVPVVSSAWQSVNEVVENKKTGLIFPFNEIGEFEKMLMNAAAEPQMIVDMKENCIRKASEYQPENIIQNLIKKLEINFEQQN